MSLPNVLQSVLFYKSIRKKIPLITSKGKSVFLRVWSSHTRSQGKKACPNREGQDMMNHLNGDNDQPVFSEWHSGRWLYMQKVIQLVGKFKSCLLSYFHRCDCGIVSFWFLDIAPPSSRLFSEPTSSMCVSCYMLY